MFMMNTSSHLFRTREDLEAEGWILQGNHFIRPSSDAQHIDRYLPLYEGKMAAIYDHRAADIIKSKTAKKRQNQPRYLTPEEKKDPNVVAMPLNWISEVEVDKRVEGDSRWLLGINDITSSTNERTMVASALPLAAVGHSEPILRASKSPHLLLAVFSSHAFDYIARQKVGGNHMTYEYLKQLSALPYESVQVHECHVTSALLELVYTSWDMEAFAVSLDYRSGPFMWSYERRTLIRAELDALMFHLYGINRVDTAYIMDTFPIVRRKDKERYGEFRTKSLILERYDAMTQAYKAAYGTLANTPNSATPPLDQASLTRYSHHLAQALATHYETNINPPPAHLSLAHPESTCPSWLKETFSGT